MKKLLLIGGLLAAAAAPSLALAQPAGCVRQDNRVAGTVAGAAIGALAGSAIAGRHDRTTGAVAGGVIGGVIGNQAAGSSVRCPDGYDYQPAATQYAPPPPPPQAYDNRGPGGPGYGGYDRGTFWNDAPTNIREREDWLERRINRGIDNGSIDRREARRAFITLNEIRSDEQRMRRRGGGRLNPQDRDVLQNRLDQLAQQINWARQTGPRGPR